MLPRREPDRDAHHAERDDPLPDQRIDAQVVERHEQRRAAAEDGGKVVLDRQPFEFEVSLDHRLGHDGDRLRHDDRHHQQDQLRDQGEIPEQGVDAHAARDQRAQGEGKDERKHERVRGQLAGEDTALGQELRQAPAAHGKRDVDDDGGERDLPENIRRQLACEQDERDELQDLLRGVAHEHPERAADNVTVHHGEGVLFLG